MSTLGARIKIVQSKSGLQQPQFAKNLGVSKETLIHYQKDRRHPDSVFLSNLCKIYRVDPSWLLLGAGEPFIGERIQEEESAKQGKVGAIEPVVQLLNEEEDRAGITLTQEQRSAILKILRELVERDVRAIRELLGSLQGEKKKRNE
jgi:transcriptional regulator with XRE-family HTH domain